MKLTVKLVFSLGLVAILAAGCATPRENPSSAIRISDIDIISPGVVELVTAMGQIDLNNDLIVCEKRKQIGSNIIKYICMTREEKKLMAQAAERELAYIQNEWERKYDVYRHTQ